MATLKFATERCLPPPRKPTRKCLPDTAVALRSLNFDAKFDIEIECTADRLVASEVSRETRLKAALLHQQARQTLASLPCACVELSKALVKEEEPNPGSPASQKSATPKSQASPAAKAGPAGDDDAVSLPEVVATALSAYHVSPSDVQVAMLGDRLQCMVHITSGDSIIGIMGILAQATKDRGGGLERGDPSKIHTAFAQAGCVEDLQVQITPLWCLERVQEAVRLVHPKRAEISAGCLKDVNEAAARSREAYAAAWTEILENIRPEDKENKDIAALLAKEPMACFGDELLTVQEGQQRSLWESWPRQDADRLSEVMADACSAQLQLKQLLAPGVEWAQAELNDTLEVPPQDERRIWVAGSFSLAAFGTHLDPGVLDERFVLDEAKWRQRPEQSEAPVQDLVNISRLVIIFRSMTDLFNAFERLLEELDVVWVDNQFRSPTCLGQRCMVLGVRQSVGTRYHISQLVLQHEGMQAVSLEAGEAALAAIRAALMRSCCIPGGSLTPCELADVTRIVLGDLGRTQGQLVRQTGRELLQVLAYATAVCGSGAAAVAGVVSTGGDPAIHTQSHSQSQLQSRSEASRMEEISVAQELVKEMTMQALRVGVAREMVQEALALANAGHKEDDSIGGQSVDTESLEDSIAALQRRCRFLNSDASSELQL